MADTPVRISRTRQSQSGKTKRINPGSLKSARYPAGAPEQAAPEQDESVSPLAMPIDADYSACPLPPPPPGPGPGPLPPPGPPIPMCGPTSTLVLQNLKIIAGTDIAVEEGYDHGIKTYKVSSNPIEVRKEIDELRSDLAQETEDRRTADEELSERLDEETAARISEDERLQELIETHPSYMIVGTTEEGLPDVDEPSEVYLYLTKIENNKVDNYREWIWQEDDGWECIGETSTDPYAADEERGLHLDNDTLTFSMKLKTTEEGEVDTDNGGLNFDDSGNLYNTSRECTSEEMDDWIGEDVWPWSNELVPGTSETGDNDEDEDSNNG